jgi:response regulator RpfG family c-di-GMP phosphodiesterase
LENLQDAKMLIAEDEPSINNMLTKYFCKNNFNVSGVADGLSAYNQLKNDNYDVCILDLSMPNKTGVEILNELNQYKDSITTSIIVLTANSDSNTIINVMKLGAFHYIQKPFDMEELQVIVKNAIWQRKMKRENIRYKYYLEEEVAKKTKEIRDTYLSIVDAFANSIEMRDVHTGGHSQRVSELAYLIGIELKLGEAELEDLRIGGILHDIGKIGISDQILRKPGKLSDDEFIEIKKHPLIGSNIVKNIPSLEKVIPSILFHQERFDGRGYPHGLKGNDIPLDGRILAVVDAFEAMISNRPYRKALSVNKAYKEIIDNSGTQFDPEIVKIFKKLWLNKKIHNLIRRFQ